MISLRAGIANVFLIFEKGKILLVDTGTKNQEKRILKAITSRGYKIEDLNFILLTHTHFDHAGSVARLKEITGATVVLHESEAGNLVEGFTRIPKGTNLLFRFISNMGRKSGIEKKIGSFKPCKPDIIYRDSLDMNIHGFTARIIHTPGHTKGSSTLQVGDRAFVGDAMFNLFGKVYPDFANDEELLLKTWQLLSELDVEWYYPSHGKRVRKSRFLKEARKKNA